MIVLIATIIAIVGALFVASGKALDANSMWAVSNIGYIWYSISICEWEIVILFSVYEVIAIFGIWNLWGKEYAGDMYNVWLYG